jgi:phytoene desaturase
MQKTAIIIGSGISGLALSIRLAKKGYVVKVFEKNEHVGGKISWIKKDGFQWGLGASLLTFPTYIDELFYLCNKNPKDYYHYHKLNPITKYFFDDRTVLNAYANQEEFANEIVNKTTEDKKTVLKYLNKIQNLYTLTEKTFLHQSLHKIKTYLSRNALKIFTTNPIKMGLLQTMHQKNKSYFKDSRIVQLFDRYATYNGSNPYKAPAVLNVIAHPEFNIGAYMMHDGMPSITANLYTLAKELGVEFILNAQVSEIILQEKKAIGIICGEQKYFADTIISNMDIYLTYKYLLPNTKVPKQYIEQEKSTSALIFYWGMSKQFPQLDVHNIFFSANYKAEFDALSNHEISFDPTIYIFVSSKINKKHAIENGENWFTLINVPNNKNQDWESITQKFREIIIQKISKILGEDISRYIITEVVNHPKSIENTTASYLGALYGNSSNKTMSTFLRHPNFTNKIKNLYFCGGSVHPGGGVPICLLSAKITDEIITK